MNYLCKWEINDIILRQSWISTRVIGIPPQYRGITGDDILGSYRGNRRFSEVETAYFRVDNAISAKLLIHICMTGHEINIYPWVKLWISVRILHLRAHSLRLFVKANISENGPVSIVSVPIWLLSHLHTYFDILQWSVIETVLQPVTFVCLSHLTRQSQPEDFIKLVSYKVSRRMPQSDFFF